MPLAETANVSEPFPMFARRGRPVRPCPVDVGLQQDVPF